MARLARYVIAGIQIKPRVVMGSTVAAAGCRRVGLIRHIAPNGLHVIYHVPRPARCDAGRPIKEAKRVGLGAEIM